jgi:hypothetical protein
MLENASLHTTSGSTTATGLCSSWVPDVDSKSNFGMDESPSDNVLSGFHIARKDCSNVAKCDDRGGHDLSSGSYFIWNFYAW